MGRLASSARRWLYLCHRWAGIALCLFMALWFVSGVVMMYVGYPKLSHDEALAHAPGLPLAAIGLSPSRALAASGVEAAAELRLGANASGRAAYLVTPLRDGATDAAPVVVDAFDGRRLPRADRQAAEATARRFFAAEGEGEVSFLGTIEEDAYTHSRALDVHRPLYRFAGGPGNTWIYVSSASGEVVRDASAAERRWNFLGAWLHWLYPLRGGPLDSQWANIVIGLSLAGTLLGISGLAVGVLRWRRRGYGNGRHSPYRSSWMRWHHLIGLACGLFVATWVFSGLMSMNPWHVFDGGRHRPNIGAYNGGALSEADCAAPLTALADGRPPREIVWKRLAGQGVAMVYGADSRQRDLRDGASGAPFRPAGRALWSAVEKLLPGTPVARVDVLDDYDAYYYARSEHTMLGHLDKPLPAWRVVFADEAATWVHLDPASGEILNVLDRRDRVKRWLFAFLHSFDWAPLLARRPLWDALLLLLSAGGAAICASGVVIGWRRLRRD